LEKRRVEDLNEQRILRIKCAWEEKEEGDGKLQGGIPNGTRRNIRKNP
jgi:hypothetical protein